jgi:hypothetical protein
MEGHLQSLEAAGLIAGIPSSIVSLYVASCRTFDSLTQTSSSVNILDTEIEGATRGKLAKWAEEKGDGLSKEEGAALAELNSRLELSLGKTPPLTRQLEETERYAFELHDQSLDSLRDALWHPILSKLRWRKRRKDGKLAEKTEAARRAFFINSQRGQELKDALGRAVDRLVGAGD